MTSSAHGTGWRGAGPGADVAAAREVALAVDGRPVRVPAGSSILEAAARAGVAIPVLELHKLIRRRGPAAAAPVTG